MSARARAAAVLCALGALGLDAGAFAQAPSSRALGRAIVSLDRCSPLERLNVRVTARRLRRLEIPPRGEFHFVEALEVRGGLPCAPGRALMDGRLLQEPGGGVCVVAGAIHAAALRAGLGLIERSGHSSRVRTLPAGLDAAVSQTGGSDLVLWNPYKFPVWLELRLDEGRSLEAAWTAEEPGIGAQVFRDSEGALVRRLADGREEVLEPAPPMTPGSRRNSMGQDP